MNIREQKKLKTRHAFFQAVLDLSMAGQSFSSISLRQVTREVGVVPTAFYRHFSDMDALGEALIKELIVSALAELATHINIGQKREYDRQIVHSVAQFFKAIDAKPQYWYFFASERFGGSEAVRGIIAKQVQLFIKLLGEDLRLQPQFDHVDDTDLRLVAEMGINLSFSWIVEWLELSNYGKQDACKDNTNADIASAIEFSETNTSSDENTVTIDPTVVAQKQAIIQRCTRQAQMLFYGAYNWQSSEETQELLS